MYSDKEKQVFSGIGRTYDPLEVRRKLVIQSGGKWNDWVVQFNEGETELARSQAEELLVAAARTAFDVKPVSQKGLTDAAVLELLALYLEWLLTPSESVTSPSPMSQPCTDCPPPSIT